MLVIFELNPPLSVCCDHNKEEEEEIFLLLLLLLLMSLVECILRVSTRSPARLGVMGDEEDVLDDDAIGAVCLIFYSMYLP